MFMCFVKACMLVHFFEGMLVCFVIESVYDYVP